MFVYDFGDMMVDNHQNDDLVYNQAESYELPEEFIATESRYGFTKMSVNDFKNWLEEQENYKYDGIQIHHTHAPSYSNFYKENGSHEDELTRQRNMKSYHVDTNGWDDIAQHFTIFPNGAIVTGRPLSNTTAIGIRGWNYNKICIEIYGNFDEGQDIMTDEQKQAVIAVYGELCKKFGIIPSVSTIRCHAWFTSSGSYLGDYTPGRSVKSCPGTNFMGFGNTKAAIENNFIPLIEQYILNTSTNTTSTSSSNFLVKINTYTLNVRKDPGVSNSVTTTLKRGEVYTITETQNGWGKLKSGAGWISLGHTERL